jgi:hypothetical protein
MHKGLIDRHPTVRNLGLALLASLLCLAAGPRAQAQDQQDGECSQQSLQGAYGYNYGGPDAAAMLVTTTTGKFWSGPVASAVGLMTFDGVGGLRAQETRTSTGPVIRRSGTGTYSVGLSNFPVPSRAECMGSATLGGDFGGLTFDFMIVPGSKGREFSLIITNPDKVQTGVARQTGDEPCSDASLEGTYRVQSAGLSLRNGPIGAVGMRILDGAGNLTWAEDTISRTVPPPGEQQIIHRAGRTATYQVLSDCTVSEVFADGATFEGVVVAEGREAYFVRTGPGNTGPIPVNYTRW